MNTKLFVSVSAALLLAASPALSNPGVSVVGEKLDSGLGALPHYSKWADPSAAKTPAQRVVGESLDDGLGALPHYSKWADPSGRDPMGSAGMRIAEIRR